MVYYRQSATDANQRRNVEFGTRLPVNEPPDRITQTVTMNNNFKNQFNPWFITGFSDAEGCFSVNINLNKNNKLKLRWKVQAFFSITLHKKDLAILEKIKFTWGVGEIYIHGKNTVQYKVGSTKELQVIIDHFEKFPLITQKRGDYLLFKSVFELMCSKEHLTCEGLQKILSLKASMNNGLPEKLKAAFPVITPSERPCVSPAYRL